jgi:hypothetical protein
MATTLLDIKNHMVSYFSSMELDDDDYYDENGHCGGELLREIKIFWGKFSTDKDFIYPIYSIIVPQGYTIVPEIKEILK